MDYVGKRLTLANSSKDKEKYFQRSLNDNGKSY